MPKPLNQTPPSSAARMLQTQQQDEASADDRSHLRQDAVAVERTTIKREFSLSPEADDALDVLVRAFRRGTATRMNNSQAMRPVLEVLAEAAQSLEQALIARRPWRMPSNGAGYGDERAEFNARLGDALRDALAQRHSPDPT